MDKANEQDEADAWRVQGEAYFLRAQFYFFLVNIYGDAYAPSTAAVKLGVPLKLTEYVEHDPDKKTQFERATVQRVYEQIVSVWKMPLLVLKRVPGRNPSTGHPERLHCFC